MGLLSVTPLSFRADSERSANRRRAEEEVEKSYHEKHKTTDTERPALSERIFILQDPKRFDSRSRSQDEKKGRHIKN